MRRLDDYAQLFKSLCIVGIEVLSASEHIDLSFLLPIEIKREALR